MRPFFLVKILLEGGMLQDYIQAMFMILIAEMGDKTQLLAMAFATKYRIKQIVIGVAIGSLLNHGLAIVLGSLLTRVVPIDVLQLIAGIMFVGFAYWSLQADGEEEEEVSAKYGPILTVAAAFFIGELGDKTQLTALTLGASATYPVFILMGTVTGMILTSLLGIFIGAKLGHKIPEMQLKLGAFVVFMVFGLEKLINSPYTAQMGILAMAFGAFVLLGLSVWRIKGFVTAIKANENTNLQKKAEALYNYMHRLEMEVKELCLGEEYCEVCKGGGCTVGFMKELLEKAAKGEIIEPYEVHQINALVEKEWSPVLTQSILKSLQEYYNRYPEEYLDNIMLSNLRAALERILFGDVIKTCHDFKSYEQKLIELDSSFGLVKL